MKSWKLGTLCVATAAVAAVLLFPQSGVKAQTRGIPVSGTIYGVFDYNFEGKGAWVGHALLSFGGKPPVAATFVDRNTSFGQKNNGAIYGTETISLNFTDGSGSFEILATFNGTPGATANLYNLSETGTIARGTGRYLWASGHVTVHGPFMFPDPTTTPGAPPWISEIHGVVLGMEER
jgi:hypothetical protein